MNAITAAFDLSLLAALPVFSALSMLSAFRFCQV
jgi:hypothetical protein